MKIVGISLALLILISAVAFGTYSLASQEDGVEPKTKVDATIASGEFSFPEDGGLRFTLHGSDDTDSDDGQYPDLQYDEAERRHIVRMEVQRLLRLPQTTGPSNDHDWKLFDDAIREVWKQAEGNTLYKYRLVQLAEVALMTEHQTWRDEVIQLIKGSPTIPNGNAFVMLGQLGYEEPKKQGKRRSWRTPSDAAHRDPSIWDERDIVVSGGRTPIILRDTPNNRRLTDSQLPRASEFIRGWETKPK